MPVSCKFWANCIFMIFIIRNDLWIFTFITIKIIRYNVFNSFFASFFSPVNQVGVYLVRGCHCIGIKHNEVSDCHVIIITKLFKNSCELLIDFSVLASAVSFRSFEATLLTAVNYCVCRCICRSHLQPMNCFRNINILYYLRGLFPPSIRDTTYFKSSFWYLHLNALIIPASSGCKRDVVHNKLRVCRAILKCSRVTRCISKKEDTFCTF